MQRTIDKISRFSPESEIYNEVLNFDDKTILELGCGSAIIATLIASQGKDRKIIAFEVDKIQHEKNLQIDDLPNVEFKFAGAEKIPEADESADIVMMFKSLHHVPLESMLQCMQEISRVLKPGGHVYISEPIFEGEFNEVLRLFNDEKIVREAAFSSVKAAVDSGLFSLVKQIFFNAPVFFQDAAEFEEAVIGTTHSNHKVTPVVLEQIRSLLLKNKKDDGIHFTMPVRVDLLSKPGC